MVVGAVPLAGQDVGPNATPAMLRTEYLANMKEVEGVRSISEVLMHIASEHYVYLPGTLGAEPLNGVVPPWFKMGG